MASSRTSRPPRNSPAEAVDQPAGEATRTRAAKRALGAGGVRRDEALLGGHVHRDPASPGVLLAAAAPERVLGELDAQVGAVVAELDAVEVELRQSGGPAPQRCQVGRPAGVAGRILGAEAAEPEQVAGEPADGLGRLQTRDRRARPTPRWATRRASRAGAARCATRSRMCERRPADPRVGRHPVGRQSGRHVALPVAEDADDRHLRRPDRAVERDPPRRHVAERPVGAQPDPGRGDARVVVRDLGPGGAGSVGRLGQRDRQLAVPGRAEGDERVSLGEGDAALHDEVGVARELGRRHHGGHRHRAYRRYRPRRGEPLRLASRARRPAARPDRAGARPGRSPPRRARAPAGRAARRARRAARASSR